MAQDTIDTGGVIRIAAVSGTLLIVGLSAIYFIFGAWGMVDGNGDTWDGMASLARFLLPLVVGGYLFLRAREEKKESAPDEQEAPAEKKDEHFQLIRRVPRPVFFIAGLILGLSLALFAVGANYAISAAAATTNDSSAAAETTNVSSTAADTTNISRAARAAAAVGPAWSRILGPITAGLCLAILVFGASAFKNLMQPPSKGLEEPVLSFYFGMVLGVLLYLVWP